MPAPAYNVTQNFALELSYRYLHLGDGMDRRHHQSGRFELRQQPEQR
jgi:opacity protein-like surface antigen